MSERPRIPRWLERLVLRNSPGLRRLDEAIARLNDLQDDAAPEYEHLDAEAIRQRRAIARRRPPRWADES